MGRESGRASMRVGRLVGKDNGIASVTLGMLVGRESKHEVGQANG